MNFDFSEEQKGLRDEARRFLAAKAPLSAARAVLEDKSKTVSFDRALWEEAINMGWLGVAIPEAYGGLGLGRLELCVLAEELGRALAAIPYSSTIYFFTEALLMAGTEAQKAALLPKVSAGEVIGCFAAAEGPGPVAEGAIRCAFDGARLTGVKSPVTDGDCATHAVVLAKEGQDLSLVLVDLSGPGIVRETLTTLDPSRGHARLVFDGAPAQRLGAPAEGWRLFQAVLNRAAVLLAFEQIGGAQASLDMAVDYARSRYAFSRPIGSFQAIKHKLAEVYVAIEIARSNSYYGAWALAADSAELPMAAAAARVAACEAFTLAAKENIQTHGGMGFTWAIDCHLFYRRAKLLAVQAGGPMIWKEKLVRVLETRNAA